jgi:hypothetical protein
MLFSICSMGAQLALGEVAVAIVDRLELAAIDGYERFREQVKLLAQHHELPTDAADCLAVILAEVGDGFEVWGEPPGQPHQFEIALAFALQASAGLDTVEVAVDVDLQQHRGVIGRPPGYSWDHPVELQGRQVELFDEGLNHPDWVLFGDEVIQALWKQTNLCPARLLDESLHTSPLADVALATLGEASVFTQPGPKADLVNRLLWSLMESLVF